MFVNRVLKKGRRSYLDLETEDVIWIFKEDQDAEMAGDLEHIEYQIQ